MNQSNLRPPLLIASMSCVLLLWTCYSAPTWVHSLPEQPMLYGASPTQTEAQEIPIPRLTGKWERKTQNQMPVAHKKTYTDSEEWIEIHGDHYKKIHLFARVTDQEEVRAYREVGKITKRGEWVLFEPTTSEQFRTIGPVTQAARSVDTDYVFPKLSDIHFESTTPPEPLLFLLKKTTRGYSLTPTLYEKLGKTYEFGLAEGATKPHDVESKAAKRQVDIWRKKRFQPHEYLMNNS